MMPDLDGYGVLHLLQRTPELANTPFMFLTAKTERADFRKGMDLGADDYLMKPFSETELLNAVESRLKKATRLQNQAHQKESQKPGYQEVFQELFEKSKTNKYKKNQEIFSEGNYPQYLFYIKSGKIKAYKTSEGGKELTVGLYTSGDFLGYIALLEESTYRISAQTLSNCELLLISRNEFDEQINQNSSFVLQFTKALVQNNNYKADQMVQLAYNSLRKRVANALLLLKEKFISKEEKQNFRITITREELANISGTTTESLIRTLSDFKSEKLIHIHGRAIEILEEEKLKNMIN
ncbi:MAG TPA: cyclic nucleotide-binding domain-containing protein, partial [Flavobacteriaceae bacterium]|nr:cyclic nucleotide-binding domain-containing protein [Flavobacteriaceae bacterium]